MRIGLFITILLIGSVLSIMIYNFKYETNFILGGLWYILILIYILISVSIVLSETKLYKKSRSLKCYKLTLCSLIIGMIIFGMNFSNEYTFHKPSLLRVYYNGDFNGTAIDFKTDGTYILDNSAIGFSSFFYGKYTIEGNRITLDKDTIDNLPNLKHLIIQPDTLRNGNLYLYKTDSVGGVDEKDYLNFRVIIDNRK